MNAHMHAGVAGFFTIEKSDVDANGREVPGTRRVVAPRFKNLILDSGLEAMKEKYFLNKCSVGAGSTPPQTTDTSLVSLIKTVSSEEIGDPGDSSTASAPFYATCVMTYVFPKGTAQGNISEIGIGNPESLFSRALILDESGAPTTITVTDIEQLTVTYEWRVYFDASDVTGSHQIGGNTYSTITRLGEINKSSAYYWNRYGGPSSGGRYQTGAYAGDINAAGSRPSGTESLIQVNNSHTPAPSGDYSSITTAHFDTGFANFESGIKSVHFTGNQKIGFQTSFTPAIPKDNTKTLDLSLKITWGRYTP